MKNMCLHLIYIPLITHTLLGKVNNYNVCSLNPWDLSFKRVGPLDYERH